MSAIFLHRFRCLWMLILLAGLLLPTMPSTVQAADPGYAYHWRIDFDFDTEANGLLTVDVGYNDDGAVRQPALHSQRFPVRCQRVGNVKIDGGVAKFLGGYLQCGVDIKGAIDQTFAECNALYPGCTLAIGAVEQYKSMKMAADLFTTASGVTPLFAHTSLTYGVDISGSMHTLQTQVAPIGNVNSSPWAVAPSPTPERYVARYVCAGGDCGIHFAVAGNAEYIDTADAPADMVTAPSTFYIGHDFAGNTLAAGSIVDNLIVDPGNGLPE
ncbi:MAG: hypothetical protein R3C14_31245 [Caldilineaceae bacterium]